MASTTRKYGNQLLDEFNIEIAGGLGPLKDKIWRVGLMGYCSQKPYVLTVSRGDGKGAARSGLRVPRRGSGRSRTELHACGYGSRVSR